MTHARTPRSCATGCNATAVPAAARSLARLTCEAMTLDSTRFPRPGFVQTTPKLPALRSDPRIEASLNKGASCVYLEFNPGSRLIRRPVLSCPCDGDRLTFAQETSH